MSRGLLTGDSYDNMAKQLQKAMQTSAFNANRLITTEAAYFQECARENTMDALNVERRQIFATLDTKTCEHCGRLDLKVIDKADCTPGVTVPPFHVFCRCTHGPYYDDEFSRQFDKRAYRDPETGKTKTAEMMSYDEWRERYLPFDITEGGKYKRLTISNPEKYAKRIMPEFSAQNFTAKELKQLWQKNGGYIQNSKGYKDINKYLRGLKSKIENPVCRITEKVLNRLTTNNALTQNYIGTRKVDMEYLNNVLGIDTDGLTKEKYRKNAQGKFKKVVIPKDEKAAKEIVAAINDLIGTPQGTIPDKAYTSVSLSENLNHFTHLPIKFELQMPKGTQGFMTNNKPESEFITKKGSSIEIIEARVYNDKKDYCIKILGRIVQ